MFRHSEVQAILRQRRLAVENQTRSPRDDPQTNNADEGELEDEAVNGDQTTQPSTVHEDPAEAKGKEKGGRGRTKKRGGFKQHVKPDLRKRTWDKVEQGVGSLDYGEEKSNGSAAPATSQRRRISYEDV
jgi:hypothetical protein